MILCIDKGIGLCYNVKAKKFIQQENGDVSS
jgi:hypothetical protein